MKDITGKVVVVTGAASGIGLGIAERFVESGTRVVMADIDERRLEQQVGRLGRDRVHGVICDVGEPASLEHLAAETLERFGSVHVICNNAGIMKAGRSWELSGEDWQAVLRVNLFGVINGVRTFLPLILGSGEEGHVVNVASMAAVVPVRSIGPYNVAKHGVLALSDTLGMELADIGAPVGVSLVMPGRVPSRLGRSPEDPVEPVFDPDDPASLPASEVGRMVVDAVRQNRMYVFTHPQRVAEVEARFARITAR